MTDSHRASSRFLVLLAAALVLLVATPSLAQKAELEGTIQDSQGNTVGPATVTVLDGEGNVLAEEQANKRGKFKIDLDAGTYVVRLESEGFAATEHIVELQPGQGVDATMPILRPQERAANLFNEGLEALQGGNSALAQERFERAAELDPQLPQAPLGLAIVYHGAKDWEAAAEAIDRVLELGGVEVPAMIVYETALNLERDELRQQAIAAVKGNPEARDAAILAYNHGVALVKEEKEEAGAAFFQEAIEIDPTLAQPYQSLAALEFNDQDYEAALPWLEKLLEVDDDNAAGLRMTFFSQSNVGNTAAATEALGKWLEVNPKGVDEVMDQATRLFENDQWDAAQQLVSPLLVAQPENAKAHLLMGQIHAASGRIPQAREELAKVVELAPDSEEAATAKAMLEGL